LIDLEALGGTIAALRPWRHWGAVSAVDSASLRVSGLGSTARRGDRVWVEVPEREPLLAEIIAVNQADAQAMWFGSGEGVAVGDKVWLERQAGVSPGASWVGRVVDAFGAPMDGRRLASGGRPVPLRRSPPAPAARRGLGARMATGLAVFDTLLPLARGQRIGLFAGSGVGKSTLLGQLARGVEADVIVIGLIGERGREVRDFVADVLGPAGMARSVVVAATSDQSPLAKRQAAWTATAVAETFRDEGRHVLLLIDSLTRFAEAHREVALAAGEAPSLRAYPPSTAHAIASLVERAGPGEGRGGPEGQGDITAVYSILVAGSDMEEPVADIARGTLDGHVVLERTIAERGRFPAVDVRRSVSRSLPGCATEAENALLSQARRLIGAYEDAEPMIRTGLYAAGSDPSVDAAIATHDALEAFIASRSTGCSAAFAALAGAISVEHASE
jgi:flagellum-specific ATP synthase